MKKIYWIGDMINNTGPANVNKSYYSYLKDDAVFCFTNNKIMRIINFFINLPFRKVIFLSGFSVLNYILVRIANLFGKKTLYLMHGYASEETKYKNCASHKKNNVENKLLNSVDKIICVSEKFSSFLKNELPSLKDKINYVNNGVDDAICLKTENIKNKKNEDIYTIITVGGGTRIKNNITICKAIDKIYLKNKKIKFIVIGSLDEDGEQIKKYNFVEYYEKLPHEEVLSKMNRSDLYIQNSYFETFGLAVVESLSCNCDLLLSKNIGAISVLQNINENSIINDNEDVEEIYKKIEKKMKNKKSINNDIIKFKNNSKWKDSSKKIIRECEFYND